MKKIATMPPSNLSILVRRIVAFGVDLALSSLVGFMVLLPILDELSRWISGSFSLSNEDWITDPGQAYILLVIMYSFAFIPLIAMPFRFLFSGKSAGCLLMKIQIKRMHTQKKASFKACLLRSPALLVLTVVGTLQYINTSILNDLYRKGPYEAFLNLHFILMLLSGVALVGLLAEWLWVFFNKDLRSPGERWTETTVVHSTNKAGL